MNECVSWAATLEKKNGGERAMLAHIEKSSNLFDSQTPSPRSASMATKNSNTWHNNISQTLITRSAMYICRYLLVFRYLYNDWCRYYWPIFTQIFFSGLLDLTSTSLCSNKLYLQMSRMSCVIYWYSEFLILKLYLYPSGSVSPFRDIIACAIARALDCFLLACLNVVLSKILKKCNLFCFTGLMRTTSRVKVIWYK